MKSKIIILLLATIIFVGLIMVMAGCRASTESTLPPQQRLRLATTTSLYDTGLWGYLEPMFEEKYTVELDIIYVGTGIALEYGRRGDVDIITVHSEAQEKQFLADGYGADRVPFAFNHFLIVGPIADPAGIKDLSPEEAFKKLMEGGNIGFVSRGDNSGTHSKEKTIWKQAGYDYEVVRKAREWYIEAGRGMGSTLLMANEKQAYTLSDAGTFLAYKGKIELVPIVDKGNILLNVYSAITVNPEKNPKTNIEMANNLISFLTSTEIQELIGNYGVKEYEAQLFTPRTGSEPK